MRDYIDGRSCGLATGIAILLAGCGGSSGSADTGYLSLGISDGPIHSALKVCIEFNGVELKGQGPAEYIPVDPPISVNLLDFQGNNAAPLLASEELPAGNYQWMRLDISADRGGNGGTGDTGGAACDGEGSYIAIDTETRHNIYVPSSAMNGLKLVGGFTIPTNGTANFTADFDLMKSVTAPPGLDPDVLMRPVIRLVNNLEAGTLTGQVANVLAEAEACEPAVYLFNDGVTPNGIEDGVDDSEDPVATALVEAQTQADESVEYHYTIGFLLDGEYEAAFTCNGTDFEPVDGYPATIIANELATVDFPGPPPPD
jgi:hypothetical protein